MNGIFIKREIFDGIYLIGGPDVSDAYDATVFLVDFGTEIIMIDSGAGRSPEKLLENIEDAGYDARNISALILTHCHIDHIGAAPFFKERFHISIIAHDLDSEAIEKGDPVRTAAIWHETTFPPTKVDRKITGAHEILTFGSEELHCLHTPGHTPGSMSLYIDRKGTRILFGQDIHGPFLPAFGSDIEIWKQSMDRLLELDADILCEGHFGIYRSKKSVRNYIRKHLNMYQNP